MGVPKKKSSHAISQSHRKKKIDCIIKLFDKKSKSTTIYSNIIARKKSNFLEYAKEDAIRWFISSNWKKKK